MKCNTMCISFYMLIAYWSFTLFQTMAHGRSCGWCQTIMSTALFLTTWTATLSPSRAWSNWHCQPPAAWHTYTWRSLALRVSWTVMLKRNTQWINKWTPHEKRRQLFTFLLKGLFLLSSWCKCNDVLSAVLQVSLALLTVTSNLKISLLRRMACVP